MVLHWRVRRWEVREVRILDFLIRLFLLFLRFFQWSGFSWDMTILRVDTGGLGVQSGEDYFEIDWVVGYNFRDIGRTFEGPAGYAHC